MKASVFPNRDLYHARVMSWQVSKLHEPLLGEWNLIETKQLMHFSVYNVVRSSNYSAYHVTDTFNYTKVIDFS